MKRVRTWPALISTWVIPGLLASACTLAGNVTPPPGPGGARAGGACAGDRQA